MANLKTEYTDIKDVTHQVEHITASNEDNVGQEQVVEALFYALTRLGKRVSAQ